MKIDQAWIISADEALRNEILKQSDDGLPKYPSVYKGYISSYGASIVQSGLVAASAFFERIDSNGDGSRYAVVRAVIHILSACDEMPGNFVLLSEYALQPGVDQRKLVKSVDKAIAALKIAIRQYKSTKEKVKNNNSENVTPSTTNSSSELISVTEFAEKYHCESDNEHSNLGWLYYRDYYHGFTHLAKNISTREIDKSGKEKIVKKGTDLELIYKKKNEFICRSLLASLSKYNKPLLDLLPCNTRLYFKTTYPGLLIGSGLSHGTGTDNDMKIGFLFDYTTGLPYIPGSSVKGVLRSMFPLVKEEKDLKDEEYNKRRVTYIQSKIGADYSKEQIILLTKAIFEDPFDKNNDKVAKRDVFMDALIDPEQEGKYFMGDDYITPHRDPLRNPIPLQFLKVLPEVGFCFSFNLYDSCLGNKIFSIAQKKELFKNILEDVGVGAKTNVGYGQLKFYIPNHLRK